MKNLLRFSLFLGLIIALTSSIKQPVPTISGLWSEHWIDSDVDYVDTLRLTQKNDSSVFKWMRITSPISLS